MGQENVRSLKETQQREGEINEEELKGAVGGVDDDMSVNMPKLAISPQPTLTVEEPEINFDMEGKPSKNLF